MPSTHKKLRDRTPETPFPPWSVALRLHILLRGRYRQEMTAQFPGESELTGTGTRFHSTVNRVESTRAAPTALGSPSTSGFSPSSHSSFPALAGIAAGPSFPLPSAGPSYPSPASPRFASLPATTFQPTRTTCSAQPLPRCLDILPSWLERCSLQLSLFPAEAITPKKTFPNH